MTVHAGCQKSRQTQAARETEIQRWMRTAKRSCGCESWLTQQGLAHSSQSAVRGVWRWGRMEHIAHGV